MIATTLTAKVLVVVVISGFIHPDDCTNCHGGRRVRRSDSSVTVLVILSICVNCYKDGCGGSVGNSARGVNNSCRCLYFGGFGVLVF